MNVTVKDSTILIIEEIILCRSALANGHHYPISRFPFAVRLHLFGSLHIPP